MARKVNKEFPKEVLVWLVDHGAWLVGSAVDWYINDAVATPRDLDIIIPPAEWQAVCRTLPTGTPIRINRFGGLKVQLGEFEVDVWPSHLEDFFEIAASYKKQAKALRLNPYRIIMDVT